MGMLEGKAALITGAGQGVGLGIAKAYAREGAKLLITGRDAKKLEGVVPELERLGGEVVICPGDAGDRSSAEAAVGAAIDAFGRLDVLVNNAQSMTPGVRLGVPGKGRPRNWVEVRGALRAGEPVVTSGQTQLADGKPVRPREETKN